MNVKKCDRCGEIYELDKKAEYNNCIVLLKDTKQNCIKSGYKELCPKCAEKLHSFLNGGVENKM